ncbi:MAG: hypothetical protein K2W96_23155 [Gemmataceae bacterium]|nr:hypothetical protein [Gemmataceae bacterium]
MITDVELRQRQNAEPFAPFRVRTSFGEVADVLHPRLMLAWGETLVVGPPSEKDPEVAAWHVHLSIPHIVAVEELATAKT